MKKKIRQEIVIAPCFFLNNKAKMLECKKMKNKKIIKIFPRVEKKG